MASSGVPEILLAAVQASVSVLLVISYGGIAAKLGLLSPGSTKAVSKVCVRMFLPALLITKIGAELHSGSAGRYGIVVLWGLACHLISFLIGTFGHFVLKMPDWVTVAVYVSFPRSRLCLWWNTAPCSTGHPGHPGHPLKASGSSHAHVPFLYMYPRTISSMTATEKS